MSPPSVTMDIDLLLVPYDSGRRGERMGAGPQALIEAGLPARLERLGHRVRRTVIDPADRGWHAEIRTAFDLAAALAAAVREASAAGRFPLVLAGNCAAALGVRAGLERSVGVIWADAHGDFNTPETTTGGFLDGMALATLTGRCWTGMSARIPGFAPVPEEHVWLIGARDLDPLERAALERSALRRLPAQAIDGEAADRIARDLRDAGPVYLHLDLDVLDPSEGHANQFAISGGVSSSALAAFCGSLRARMPPAACTLSAYDPAADPDGRVCESALRAVEALLAEAPVAHR